MVDVDQIVFQDQSMIDSQKFPMFHKKMLELAKPIAERTVFNAQDTV